MLRRGRPEPLAVAAAAGEVFTRGGAVRWPGAAGQAAAAGLPGYAFQRERFWLARPAADVASAGLAPGAHPLVAAVAELADGQGWVLSGRLTPGTEQWLADHVIGGLAVVPGTAVTELAAHAATVTGCGGIAELVMEAPLLVPDSGVVAMQVQVGPAEPDGRRPVGIFSREDDEFGQWRRHAAGTLAGPGPEPAPEPPAPSFTTWPPKDALPLPVADFYPRMAAAGAHYGPSFLGLRAGWRRGEELFAEVALPAGTAPGRWAVHPALLDAALQAGGLLEEAGGELRAAVPFSWTGVTLRAGRPQSLRVRISPQGAGRFAVTCADPAGNVVFSAGSLTMRPLADGWFARRGGGTLLTLDWHPASPADTASPVGAASSAGWAVLGGQELPGPLAALPRSPGPAALATGAAPPLVALLPAGAGWAQAPAEASDQPQQVHAATSQVLTTVQQWLSHDELAGSRLVVLTRGAVPVPGEDPADLAGAAVWGLVRSAQSEHPGRLVLADVDQADGSLAALAAVAGSGEPQALVRGGQVLLPRLERATTPQRPGAPGQQADPEQASPAGLEQADAGQPVAGVLPHLAEGQVLVTGGTGTLGGLVARHLAAAYGVPSLTLVSRRGPAAPGAAGLAAAIASQGAAVRVTAADAAARDELAAVLGRMRAEGPLTGVVHCAGVIDDGAVGSLSPGRLGAVLGAKADGAWFLHELTAGDGLGLFALFSSASGVFGAPGQGGYAAANAFLDGLAARRRAGGLAGVSLAWGLWEPGSALTAGLSRADRVRAGRSGVGALGAGDGLALLDEALAGERAVVVPLRLDPVALRAGGPGVPRLLARLAGPARPAAPATDPARFAGLSGQERSGALLDLVRRGVSEVLGHADPAAVLPDRAFSEQGFDSLTAVELRNRLTTETGLTLPATLVFDYPTAHALSQYLDQSMPRADVPSAAPALDALDRLAQELAAIAADHPDHARIGRRLRAVAAGWAGRSAPGGDAGLPAGADDRDGHHEPLSLDTADDDAVFDYLTNELGIE